MAHQLEQSRQVRQPHSKSARLRPHRLRKVSLEPLERGPIRFDAAEFRAPSRAKRCRNSALPEIETVLVQYPGRQVHFAAPTNVRSLLSAGTLTLSMTR